MLVRIGDEKRDVLEQHMNVLKTKITDTDGYVVDTREQLIQQLAKVITNMPHKLKIYTGIIYLIATENAEFAAGILTELFPTLLQVSFIKADAFKSRNTSAWIGQLYKYGLLSDEAFLKFTDTLR